MQGSSLRISFFKKISQYHAFVAVWIAIIVWSSAYVAIRAALEEFSPGGLALLRYLVASACMIIFYFFVKDKKYPSLLHIVFLMLLGVIGVGFYNVFLNYGEQTITSGVSAFIISQSPLLTAFFAAIFLREKLIFKRVAGFFLSIVGIGIMTVNELNENLSFSIDLLYIFLATAVAALYPMIQKPLLKFANPIEATTFIILGSTLFLCFYLPDLSLDLNQVSNEAITTVLYLGIFPAAIGYVMWSYALNYLPTAQVVSYLYFSPFLAALIGWYWLEETMSFASIIGGIVAMYGVYLINRSYKNK